MIKSPAMMQLTHTNLQLSMGTLVKLLIAQIKRWLFPIILGETQADVKEKSGQERYNAKITAVWSEEMGEGLKQMTEALTGLCVILEGGEKAFGKGNHKNNDFGGF